MRDPLRQIVCFLLLVIGISFPFWSLIIHAGHLDIAHGRVVHMLMWSPALAALLTCRLFGVQIEALGWAWKPMKYQLLAYCLPVIYGLLAYLPLWLLGVAPIQYSAFAQENANSLHLATGASVVDLLLLATFGVIQSLASALGEEIGWRGFLLPALNVSFRFHTVILLSGLVWAAWHYPILLFADYNAGTPAPFALSCFTVMIVATGAIAAWLRLQSGSLWPPAVFHASHNLFIQSVFDRLTATTTTAKYFSGEFGLALALVTAIIAMFFLRRASKAAPLR
jgi:membrane protease YdiL (CAAX protease family)